MKRKSGILGVALLIVTILTGCGAKLPEMTKEQEEAVVEYAAGVLMRHMKDYDSRLVDLSLYKEDAGTDETENGSEEGGMDQTEDTEIVDITQGEEWMSMGELLMPEGVELVYNGFAVTSTYPEGEDALPYFSLDATEGSKLIVMSFILQNVSETDKEIDLFSLAPKFTLTVNDTKKQNILSTLLLEDLSTFMGTIGAGGTVSLVLLAEVEESIAADIGSMKLEAKTEAGKAILTLQ